MKITNNTDYNITLINNKIIKPHKFIILINVDEDLKSQLEFLERRGIIIIENL